MVYTCILSHKTSLYIFEMVIKIIKANAFNINPFSYTAYLLPQFWHEKYTINI